MAYHADVEFLQDANPRLIERNADEFGRLRDLLDSVEPEVRKAQRVDWHSDQRQTYDARLSQALAMVRELSDGLGRARNALLRYADEVERAKRHLATGEEHETTLKKLVDQVATALTRTAQEAEPMRQWEDIRSTTGFLDWLAELGMDKEAVREDAEAAYSAAEAAFERARRVEEDARIECLKKLQAAGDALPDFRGGDFAAAGDLAGLVDGFRQEVAEGGKSPLANLPGGEAGGSYKNPFPAAGDENVSPALQEIRDRLKGLPEGESSWVSDAMPGGKAEYIRNNRELIMAAAKESGLPPDLLAGIAWKEVGGKPYALDDFVAQQRELAEQGWHPLVPENLPGPLGGHQDATSFGPMAVQTRRAAEVLGYDPQHLTAGQREELQTALKDPAQNLFISAKYLANLKAESGFADIPADQLTTDQYRELAARYNGGPYWENDQAQAYADDFGTVLPQAREALG